MMHASRHFQLIALFTITLVMSHARAGCGGGVGFIGVTSCANNCQSDIELGGKYAPSYKTCAEYCSCLCNVDKDVLEQAAVDPLTDSERSDRELIPKFCKAREWPEFFQMPEKFVARWNPPVESIQKIQNKQSANHEGVGYQPFDDPPDRYNRAPHQLVEKMSELDPDFLVCAYSNGNKPGFARFYHWAKQPTKEMEDLISADKTGVFRRLGNKGFKHCPKSFLEARQVEFDTIVSGGFKPGYERPQ